MPVQVHLDGSCNLLHLVLVTKPSQLGWMYETKNQQSFWLFTNVDFNMKPLDCCSKCVLVECFTALAL